MISITRVASVASFLVLSTLPSAEAQTLEQCNAGILADSVKPSREGFLREVLFAAGTSRTPKFDDYTEGSYHVNKLDLVTGLPNVATKCGLQLRAVLVVGPLGPLWAFHVFAFLQDSSGVRVNALVMPHARITGKATRKISEGEADAFLAIFDSLAFLKAERPSGGEDLLSDFGYDLLAVVYGPSGPRFWTGSFPRTETDETKALSKSIEGLMTNATQTYSHGN